MRKLYCHAVDNNHPTGVRAEVRALSIDEN